MKTKIQIKSVFGKLLFEYETENNTLKKTIENANLSDTDLRGANLSDANLSGADLRGANLRRADLSGADLRGAYLSDANLSGAYLSGAYLSDANLRRANLRRADLRGADLSGANLSGAYLSGAYLSDADLPMFCKWGFSIVDESIKIGCETKTIKEWDLFFNGTDIIETKRDTQEFKQIQAVYNGLKAYHQTLNN
jgi:hypothetical protein